MFLAASTIFPRKIHFLFLFFVFVFGLYVIVFVAVHVLNNDGSQCIHMEVHV